MKRETVSPKTNKAIGPYSQAIEFGDFIFVSGQIGIDPETGILREGIREQVKQIMMNLKSLLEAGHSDINNILKSTVYLADMGDFPVMNSVYETYFRKPYPARATIQVAKLPKDALIEIECIAYKYKDQSSDISTDDDKKGCCGEECQCCK